MIEEYSIDSFTSVITGGTPSTSKEEYWNDGNIPWLNSGELQQDIITKSSNFITDLGLKNSSSKLMPKDSILIALTGTTTGKVGYLTFEACANQSVTGILPSNKHIAKHLYYYLYSIRSKVMSDAYGGAQPHISQAYVKKIKIPLPPLETQKHIAQILDDAAALRDKTRQLIKEYDALAQSIFLDMFGDPVRNDKGWENKTLKEICNKITDGTHDTPQRLTEGIKFITGKHIRPFKIDYENSDYVTEEVHQEIYRRCNPEFGDILYTNIGVNFGTAAMNIVDYEFSMKNVALLKYDRKFVNGRYLESLLNNENFKDRLKKVFGIGGAQQFLSLSNIKSVNILIPPITLQNQFAEKITLIEQQKELAKQEIKESEDLFNCLLQKAFKGQLT